MLGILLDVVPFSYFRSLFVCKKLKFDYLQGLPIETCYLYIILCNRWFYVESGSVDSPSVILIHGFPSQVSSSNQSLRLHLKQIQNFCGIHLEIHILTIR